MIFSGALALRQMGIAESIVNLAFGLLLGAIAVAAALSRLPHLVKAATQEWIKKKNQVTKTWSIKQ